MQYATRDRRAKKRNFRALWIQRINAAVRDVTGGELTYARFIDLLANRASRSTARCSRISRSSEPASFAALVEKARGAAA